MTHRTYDLPPTEFHPEFGYLCPSRKLRHSVRVALAAATFGLVTGAVGVMVVFPRAGRDLRIEHAAAAVPGDTNTATPIVGAAIASPLDKGELRGSNDGVAERLLPAPTTGRRIGAPKAAATAAAAEAQKPCKEETWPYFDSKCLWGPRKDATVGMAATPSATTPSAAAAAADVAPTATDPSEQAAAKKKTKTANTSPRRRKEAEPDPRIVDPRTAYANPYASPSGPLSSFSPQRLWGW